MACLRYTSHSWLGAFAARLLELHPQTKIGTAIRAAVRTYHDAIGFDPRVAAEHFLVGGSMPCSVKNRDPEIGTSSPASRYESMFSAPMPPTRRRQASLGNGK